MRNDKESHGKIKAYATQHQLVRILFPYKTYKHEDLNKRSNEKKETKNQTSLGGQILFVDVSKGECRTRVNVFTLACFSVYG